MIQKIKHVFGQMVAHGMADILYCGVSSADDADDTTHGSLVPLSRSVAAKDGSEVEHNGRDNPRERHGSSGKGRSQDEGKEEDGCTGKLGSEKSGDLSSHFINVGQCVDQTRGKSDDQEAVNDLEQPVSRE